MTPPSPAVRKLCALAAWWLVACAPARAAEPLPEPPVSARELSAALADRRLEQDYFAAEVQQPEHELPRLGELAPYTFDPASPMPEAPAGQSAVVADGGLLYDNTRSTLSYIGNVRLNDERVQLRAAYRLYVRLPERGKNTAEPTTTTAAPPAAEAAKAPAAKAPAAAHKPGAGKAATPAAPAAKPTAEPPAPQAAEPPAHITTENASVDLVDSRLMLEGRSATPSLTITRGSDSLSMERNADGSVATVYAGSLGDILLLGRNITLNWSDAEGGHWRLVVTSGPVYYSAARHCLVALGESQLTSPRYSMQALRALYIVLTPEESAPGTRRDPFSSFTTARFKDIDYICAYGSVRLSSAAAAGAAPSVLRGEALRYDAASGECRIIGEPCTLEYGSNTMQAPGAITLLGNGDALITAPTISGTYERPFATTPQAPAATTRGTYKAPGPANYDAQRNCITLPRGISAVDEHGAFSCTGRVVAYLAPRPGAKAPKAPRPGMRMPNLALASQGGISRITAEGQVRLRSDASATTPAYRLESDTLEADLSIGTASLRTGSGRRIFVRYGDYLLTAQSPQSGEAEAHLLSNGDLRIAAAQVHATIPGEDGPTKVDCTESLVLQRAKNLLTLGPASCLRSPAAIFTARAPLSALLEEGAPGTAPAGPAKFPHLSYNYTGLRRVDTPSGGTLRTTQASLECEGAIAFELKPGARPQGSADARSIIRTASARNRVQVAGKDADGRLMRASGDRLDFDSASSNFYLRGSSVTLVDEYNSHTASGRGACITVDPHNNVYITGEHHVTTASQVHRQMEERKKQKK